MIRKSLIYKTGVEYGDYTLNHVQGCAHGCRYPCYAFTMAKRFGKVKTYEEWCKPQIVENTLELLDKELIRYRNHIQKLHLCFTTDPFMYDYPEIAELSMEVLRRANAQGVLCSVLTKGILPQELVDLPMQNEYGVTLVSLDDDFIQEYEPHAAPIVERLDALRYLHERGCSTWVSIEPYPTPNMIEQDLGEILEAVSFTDNIIFGRLHYNKIVSEYKEHQKFYNACAYQVMYFCQEHGIHFHIKNGTQVNEKEK
jgi:DNA repair photolyase